MVVTISPEEHARATTSLEIHTVRSFASGRLYSAKRLIERPTYSRLIRIRTILRGALDKEARIVCAMCGTSVYLVAETQKSFFFRHSKEDGRCRAITRSKLAPEEINALKYLGARESPAHIETKRFIERSLRADAAFSNILEEKRWNSGIRPSMYRQPDVQAKLGDTRVAFEVQLSTTFLHVVVGRREFYRGEKAMLLWVLRRFDPEDRRLTIDDLLFNNNSNILVVDDETVRLSEEQSTFIARCWYREPYLERGQMEHRWSNALVRVRDMTFDVEEQLAFGFDVQGRKTELHVELARLAEQERLKQFEAAREAFFRFCEYRTNYTDHAELEADFYNSTAPLRELDVPMPVSYSGALTFIQHTLALRSIQLGKPVGYRYTKLVQVLHTMAESYKDFVYYVGHALNIYERNELVASQDPSGKWAKRREAMKAAMKDGDPAYGPTIEWAETFPVLFPALAIVPRWAAMTGPSLPSQRQRQLREPLNDQERSQTGDPSSYP